MAAAETAPMTRPEHRPDAAAQVDDRLEERQQDVGEQAADGRDEQRRAERLLGRPARGRRRAAGGGAGA